MLPWPHGPRRWRATAAAVVAPVALALAASAGLAQAQEDLSSGGRIEFDIWPSAEHPPEASLDGDPQTHWAHHRLEDADWRLWLSQPAVAESVTFIQAWSDWSQALEVRLEAADGTVATVDLEPGTRAPQSFALPFEHPTAFVDVYVVSATDAASGDGWGGFAEMRVEGTPISGDTTPPITTDVAIDLVDPQTATVRWTTDEPATSQVRYSTEAVASLLTAPDRSLVREHAVVIEAEAPLRGQLELRSADAAGNRAELRHDAFARLAGGYRYGVGSWSFYLDDRWVPAPELFAQDGLEVGISQLWLGGSEWSDWLTADHIRGIHEAGYTPELIHHFFGDPVLEDVIERRQEFLDDVRTLAELLSDSGVGSEVLVTLEPEYNQGEVATWDGWNDLMIEAIEILRSEADCQVGLLAGDWDFDHLLPISMGRAAAQADFVAFQEMRASTRHDPDEVRAAVDRAIRFAHYLWRKFLRPVRLGYAMVSDYGGWASIQRDFVIELCERHQELAEVGVVDVSWMSYLDNANDPAGYFGEAEYHKGLKYADAQPKPAWHVFKECVANGPSWLDTGVEPPGAIPPEEPTGDGCVCAMPPARRVSLGWLAACWFGLLTAARRRGRSARHSGPREPE